MPQQRILYNIGKMLMLLFIFFQCSAIHGNAQQYDTNSKFKLPIQLDTFVVKSGFDIDVFIGKIKNDTTFYKAFRSMKTVAATMSNNVQIFGRHGGIAASMQNRTKQIIKKGCRTTIKENEVTTGNFYDSKGRNNYYTGELFEYLFFTKMPECNLSDVVAGNLETHGLGQIEKNKYELKQLIFNPGSKITGVPLVGGRASIFEESQKDKYIFRVTIDTMNGKECFVFKITPKQEYKDNVVFNELTTWFDKDTYIILARNYNLSFYTILYDFNVSMQVRTIQKGNKLYPSYIFYDGEWHILTKKRERASFTITIDYQ